jgi:predicted anti-sigma-YlaC factor YlaD
VTAEPVDLPCNVVVELITDYLDGALAPLDRSLLEAHLAECDGCTAVLEQFATTVRVAGQLGTGDVEELDAATRDDLLGAFRSWAADRRPE